MDMLISGPGMVVLHLIIENVHGQEEDISVEQQECDGENINLVQGENNDAPDKNMENDTCRAQEDKSDEERNVRP